MMKPFVLAGIVLAVGWNVTAHATPLDDAYTALGDAMQDVVAAGVEGTPPSALADAAASVAEAAAAVAAAQAAAAAEAAAAAAAQEAAEAAAETAADTAPAEADDSKGDGEGDSEGDDDGPDDDRPEPETSQPDLPNSPEIASRQNGTPLVFKFPAGKICSERTWTEQDHYLPHFNFNMAGVPVILDTKFTCGLTMFVDWNGDNELSNGVEWLHHVYWEINVYGVLATPSYDHTNDGWFDTQDVNWPKARVMDLATRTVKHPEEYGIIGFNYSSARIVPDDFTTPGSGQYANCDCYIKDWKYKEAVDAGWLCTTIDTDHFRVVAWNPWGILLSDRSFLPSYDHPIGWRTVGK